MIEDVKPEPGLIIVWEFGVEPDKQREFENVYGAGGVWAQLFRQGDGYIKTELHPDPKLPGKYLTLDFWESPQAFEKFKQAYSGGYQAIDEQCRSLTAEEKCLGHCKNLHQLQSLLSEHGFGQAELSSGLQIRQATPCDVPAMLAIEQAERAAAHWPQRTYDELFNPDAPLRIAVVAESGTGTLLGFAVARITGEDCELENIAVSGNQQRRGIGKRLLSALIKGAKLQKSVCIHLEVRESNAGARALYESCGFHVSGQRANYYSAPSESALIYQRQL